MPSITLTVDNTQAARLATAFGRLWDLRDANNNPRDATLAEVRIFLVQRLRDVVISYEKRKQEEVASTTVADLAVT